MIDRTLIGYSLLVMLISSAVISVWWRSRNTFEIKYREARRREQERYLEAMKAKDDPGPDSPAGDNEGEDSKRSKRSV